jgi:hypothetical protein
MQLWVLTYSDHTMSIEPAVYLYTLQLIQLIDKPFERDWVSFAGIPFRSAGRKFSTECETRD